MWVQALDLELDCAWGDLWVDSLGLSLSVLEWDCGSAVAKETWRETQSGYWWGVL